MSCLGRWLPSIICKSCLTTRGFYLSFGHGPRMLLSANMRQTCQRRIKATLSTGGMYAMMDGHVYYSCILWLDR